MYILLFINASSAFFPYPEKASIPIEHGWFYFAAPVVSFLEQRGMGISEMLAFEELVKRNMGAAELANGNLHLVLAGVDKSGAQHAGCFDNDSKCRIIGLFEIPRK
ncbi:MAG: hypothetical protein H6850_00685 [Alphaproteobacteria bacterium]|nr:MAG: hypothetical protein H6850_00685 [Alphaproteobacteria bacterium]